LMIPYHRCNFPVKKEAAERHRSVAGQRKIVIANPARHAGRSNLP
jgi:hypothetical protein